MTAATDPLISDTDVDDEVDPEPAEPLPVPLLKLFEALGEEAGARISEGLDRSFPARPRRSETALAALVRVNRMAELDFLYRQWIDREVTLTYVQLTADLTDEECDILYRGRDTAMRIDRLGKVTYDEPTLLRAVCAVVGG